METPLTPFRWPDLKPGSGAAAGLPFRTKRSFWTNSIWKGSSGCDTLHDFTRLPSLARLDFTGEEEKRKRWMGHKTIGDKSRTGVLVGIIQVHYRRYWPCFFPPAALTFFWYHRRNLVRLLFLYITYRTLITSWKQERNLLIIKWGHFFLYPWSRLVCQFSTQKSHRTRAFIWQKFP